MYNNQRVMRYHVLKTKFRNLEKLSVDLDKPLRLDSAK